MCLTEPPRGLADIASLLLAAPWLLRSPRGTEWAQGQPLPVPSTALYSKHDGVVPWQLSGGGTRS
ncbi:hypothetical protein [Rhodococcus sp. IEGM 1379]|uniref:hypothetical protein n=1 Tax=Rhodococcus sp. IEGM 1379 TaxID=3047086 RepID=UPI0024B7D138|nr:hypothetical protein [Rhodococcus sp. IEGM 1379]MDI9917181.1 hypothetical protein [Rhodococcus sp. IEGM 1379]